MNTLFTASQLGQCWTQNGSTERPQAFHAGRGSVLTGKSRVHEGYWAGAWHAGDTFLGRGGSVRTAVLQLAAKLQAAGHELLAVGLSPNFYETGLSMDSGFGYAPGPGGSEQRFHMFDHPQAPGSSLILMAPLLEPVSGPAEASLTCVGCDSPIGHDGTIAKAPSDWGGVQYPLCSACLAVSHRAEQSGPSWVGL
jgi:hypothetical protein